MGDVRDCIFFFRSNLQPIEQQTYKSLSTKKMKKNLQNNLHISKRRHIFVVEFRDKA